MMSSSSSVPHYWWVLAVAVTILCSGLYAVGQQVMRHSANDPQIQIAEDIAYALEHGGDAHALVGSASVEISQSLAPFTIIYNEAYQMIASNVRDAQIPVIPRGVLEYTRQFGTDRVTWQPAPALRIASVVQHVESGQGGFVLVGRSLREVERRMETLFQNVVIGWVVTLTLSLLMAIGFQKKARALTHQHKK